jgi:hypothetical protein
MASFSFLSLYKKRFKSSWELFTKVFLGLFIGTLVCVAFVYVFRLRLGAFPTSVFVISSGINLFLIFKINQIILKAKKRIKKQVIIIGNGKVDDIINKKAIVERKRIEDIKELQQYQYIHEIIISEKINAKENLNFLLYIAKKHNTQIYFSSSVYMAILREKLNGENSLHFLSTFVGRKTDLDELLIRATDLFGSLIFLLVFVPVMLFISLLIETTSEGPVLYKQKRVGKDGKTFIIFKFRTMKNNTGKQTESESAKKDDPRVTTVGKLLRPTRLDELPQLFNVLKGDMSLVGP